MSDELDFTEEHYRAILRRAREGYRFEPFGTDQTEPHVIWRHDLDCSIHRALALAEIEAQEGVAATYFVLLHSEFYNAMELAITQRLRRVTALGHQIGLHFDPGFWNITDAGHLEERLAHESGLLSDLLDTEVKAFSFHNPDVGDALRWDAEQIAGMTNAYGRQLRADYGYVSDSNGYWRYRRLFDVLDAQAEPRLQVLTHPEWWVPEPASPSARIDRALQGRAARVRRDYDALLAQLGRENVGAATAEGPQA